MNLVFQPAMSFNRTMNRPTPIKTPFTEMFSIDYPIISAPMFLVSNEQMVIAASEAGGMGTFPAMNFRPMKRLSQAVTDIQSGTKKPFGVNIIVQKSNKYQDEQLDLAIEQKIPLIITSLGSPRDVLRRTQGTKTKVFCDVVGLEHAKKCQDLGADGLIAVGHGAGGHAGDTSLMALIPQLKKRIPLPLVAAGSIGDGPTMAAALALGADAVYMGTRMIASKESPVDAAYKKAIVSAQSEDIVNTDKVDGFPGNFIKTPLLEKALKTNLVEGLLSQSQRMKRWISLARAGRALFGNPKSLSYKTIFSAGHGVSLIEDCPGIEQIIHETMNDYYATKNQLP